MFCARRYSWAWGYDGLDWHWIIPCRLLRVCAVLVFAAIAGQRHKNYKRNVVKQRYNIDEPEQRVESWRRQKVRQFIDG